MQNDNEFKHGVLYALLAYGLWGIAPIYFKQISEVPVAEILIHRIVWSFVLISILLLFGNGYQKVIKLVSSLATLKTLTVTSLLLSANWFTFIWAVNHGHVLDASLGYFINPLLYVFLGLIFFQERLRKLQWLAVGIAGLGVLWAIVSYGHIPWISVALALTFGFYGLLRKKVGVEALAGLYVETMLIVPLALGYYLFFVHSPSSNLMLNNAHTNLLLIAAGIVTTAPLLAFASAAVRIPLSVLGFTQYLGPTLMFALGLFLYHEALSAGQAITFVFIWSALMIFAFDGMAARRARRLQRG